MAGMMVVNGSTYVPYIRVPRSPIQQWQQMGMQMTSWKPGISTQKCGSLMGSQIKEMDDNWEGMGPTL